MANATNTKQSNVGDLIWPKCNCLYFGVDKTLEVTKGKKVEPYQPKLLKNVHKNILAKSGNDRIKRFTEKGKAIKDMYGRPSIVNSLNIKNILLKKLELKKQKHANRTAKTER